MKLTLVHFQTDEEINLDADNPVIIGRGELFGCSDKKVSRSHGQLQLTPDGRVHVIALHKNPCFVMKNGLPPVIQLKKDEEKFLHDGDYIGLLPDSFWYKIVLKRNDELSNNCNDLKPDSISSFLKNVDQVNDSKVSCKKSELRGGEPNVTPKASVKPSVTDKKSDSVDIQKPSSPLNPLTERLKALEPTRKLPLSEYQIEGIPDDINEIYKTDPVEVKLNNIENKYNSTSHSFTPQDDNIEEPKPSSSSTAEVKEESAAGCSNNTVDNNENGDYNNQADSQKRPICQYEEKCYRVNEQHKRDFSHPGDPDFVPYDERPICQYGAACYRKNRAHWVEYKHPKKKGPKKGDGKTGTNFKKNFTL
ncbi:UNVERIFIED_CONTAM: hypothetical protein PYX00_007609 [Menopon gallinae]|uniref:Aprataxin and PNK-like factor n=1 Tax=Menopon gallinae TaxID=328185 RepID=A0AAW2HKB8_9NEOP